MGGDVFKGVSEIKVQQHEIKFVSQEGVVIITQDNFNQCHKLLFEKDIKNECYQLLTNLKKDDVLMIGFSVESICYIKYNNQF
jgi:hypothetical protein